MEYQDGFTHVILADQMTMPSPLDPAAAWYSGSQVRILLPRPAKAIMHAILTLWGVTLTSSSDDVAPALWRRPVAALGRPSRYLLVHLNRAALSEPAAF